MIEGNSDDQPGRHYVDRINGLIADLQHERARAADPSAARNVSLAITHLEDALLRIAPPESYQPNPGAGVPA